MANSWQSWILGSAYIYSTTIYKSDESLIMRITVKCLMTLLCCIILHIYVQMQRLAPFISAHYYPNRKRFTDLERPTHMDHQENKKRHHDHS